ncbi:MAG TPA: hypothetical protein PKD90_06495 [Phnomibacter sp.]|nr:hypothetical protein [Phnomibacter sp.]
MDTRLGFFKKKSYLLNWQCNWPGNLLALLMLIWALLFGCINLHEWYLVKFTKAANHYPFGPLADNGWHYASATLYANYCLACGLGFLLAAGYLVKAMAKQQWQRAKLAGLTVLILAAIERLITTL